MWSLERIAGRGVRLPARLFLAAAVAGSAGGCLRPLYGPTATGEPLKDVLAAVDVQKVVTTTNRERIGHYLRSELIFDLDGSGEPAPKRYKLALVVRDGLSAPIVDTTTGRAVSATLNADADYALTNLDGTQTITRGTASASASYERSAQRFGDVRAARDAEIRAAKLLAEQIKVRLSAALVSRS
ncbi:MAG TPA: LPS assembly lipoprotein LptE [Beijerinckiaceae bacterium]|jgi:LPS-assembly lipoprotein